jgi:glycyl-tRNA synthetase beta chain
LELAAGVVPDPAPDAAARLMQFLVGRVEGTLVDRGFGVEVVRAVLGRKETRIARLPSMTQALSALAGTPALADVVTGWRRTSVLTRDIAARDVKPGLLKEQAEIDLNAALRLTGPMAGDLFESGRFDDYLLQLARLRAPIDRCLDEVLIMAEDSGLRANRLALLGAVSDLFTRYADFAHVLPLVGREG